jgi:hypothetical protein
MLYSAGRNVENIANQLPACFFPKSSGHAVNLKSLNQKLSIAFGCIGLVFVALVVTKGAGPVLSAIKKMLPFELALVQIDPAEEESLDQAKASARRNSREGAPLNSPRSPRSDYGNSPRNSDYGASPRPGSNQPSTKYDNDPKGPVPQEHSAAPPDPVISPHVQKAPADFTQPGTMVPPPPSGNTSPSWENGPKDVTTSGIIATTIPQSAFEEDEYV